MKRVGLPASAHQRRYQALITWAETHGRIEAFGVEGTGSDGAGLARAVRRAGHRVVEVNRGDRRTRRAAGKSDTIDAEVAARSVLAGQSTAIPKTADGAVEMMRQLKITRDTAVKARTTAMHTPEADRRECATSPARSPPRPHHHGLLTRCAGLRPGPLDTPTAAAKHTLRALARRWMALTEEMAIHDQHLTAPHDRDIADPSVRAFGVGAHTAAQMLIIFGDTPDRIRSEARLCEAVRGLSDPGFVRDDDRPASSLSGWAPTSERRPPSHGRRPHAAPPADGRRRRPPDGWRPDQTRDQPLPQTLPRP